MEKHINEIAYEIAKQEFKDKEFSFDDLATKVVKRIKASTKDVATVKGELYSEIMQDTNFLYLGKKVWRLREYVDQTNLKRTLASSLYDFDKSLTEEDYEDLNDLTEQYDEESGMYFDEEEEDAAADLKSAMEDSKDSDDGE